MPASLASFAGGRAGAQLVLRRGETFVRRLFLVTVLAMAVKPLVDLVR